MTLNPTLYDLITAAFALGAKCHAEPAYMIKLFKVSGIRPGFNLAMWCKYNLPCAIKGGEEEEA
jgi:hypothetical protein